MGSTEEVVDVTNGGDKVGWGPMLVEGFGAPVFRINSRSFGGRGTAEALQGLVSWSMVKMRD